MANPAMNITLTDQEVGFAILTGKGVENKNKSGDDRMEYSCAVIVNAKQKEALLKQITEFYEAEASAKWQKSHDNDKDPETFFTVSKDDKKKFLFWASQGVKDGIKLKRASGTDFGIKQFATLGSGSKIDAEYRIFWYEHNGKEGIGLRLSAVQLNEYVEYSGGGGNTLDGEEIPTEDGIETATPEKVDYTEAVKDFEEALGDKDFKLAKTILGDLEGHEDYKKFKKALKKAKA